MIEWCFMLCKKILLVLTCASLLLDRANLDRGSRQFPAQAAGRAVSGAEYPTQRGLQTEQRRRWYSLREEVMRPNLAVVGALPRDELRAGLIRRRSLAPRPWVLRGIYRGAW